MNRYTTKELNAFAELVGHVRDSNGWPEFIKDQIEKYKDLSYRMMVKEILTDLVYHCFGIYCESPRFKLTQEFLFKKPLQEMPLYINSEKSWERLFSQWRLSIDR